MRHDEHAAHAFKPAVETPCESFTALRIQGRFFCHQKLAMGVLLVLPSAPMSDTPVVDVSSKTVNHAGTTFTIRPLAEDEYTVLVNGVPVGRIVYSFGAANAVVESKDVSEDVLWAVGESWFAALENVEAAS